MSEREPSWALAIAAALCLSTPALAQTASEPAVTPSAPPAATPTTAPETTAAPAAPPPADAPVAAPPPMTNGSAPSAASLADSGSELELFALEDLMKQEVASSTKIARRASKAPSAISVVSRREIDDYGYQTINDILFHQPGFFPSHDYERVTVGARGNWESWNNNHILLLIDGVPVNDTETGGAYTWEITPLYFAKSVEVIRGPGSALYGTNATNGVVAINTYSAEDFSNGMARARFRIGNDSIRGVDGMVGYKNEYVAALVNFSGYATDGNQYLSYDASGRTNDDGSLKKFEVQDGRRNTYLMARLEAQGALKGLSLEYNNQDYEYETGHGWFFAVPDVQEYNRESRQSLKVSYKRGSGDEFIQEYVVRYQRHLLHHNLRFEPAGAYDGYYPQGVSELIQTHFDDLFARAQVSKKLWSDSVFLAGAEYLGFFYNGDEAHFSNANLSNYPDYEPFPDGMHPLLPYYEWIQGRPVNNLGVYGQFVSGDLLGKYVEATLGVRYDRQFFNYRDLNDPDHPVLPKAFDQVAPRVGLVFSPMETLHVKALAGRAFRAPAPLEMFGANTWAVGSNLAELNPEYVTTYEVMADWAPTKTLTARVNGFHTTFEHQIAYGPSNVLVNYYSRTNAGAELELLYGSTLGGGDLNAFANYSFVKQLSEKVEQEGIDPSAQLTWAPSSTAKAGASYKYGPVTGALELMYYGAVERRASDVASYPDLRPNTLPAFVTVDANVSYKINSWLSVGGRGTNLLDTKAYYVKGGDFAFDYQIEGRRLQAYLEAEL